MTPETANISADPQSASAGQLAAEATEEPKAPEVLDAPEAPDAAVHAQEEQDAREGRDAPEEPRPPEPNAQEPRPQGPLAREPRPQEPHAPEERDAPEERPQEPRRPEPVAQEPRPPQEPHAQESGPRELFPAEPHTQQPRAQAPPPVVTAVADSEHPKVPSIERALSGPSKDRNLSWRGKVRIVAGATQGPGARDQEALDRARARLPLNAPKRVLMLGCTSGAGQTVTALMTGYIIASLREQPVAAVDLHDGSLARYSAPAGWLEDILRGKAPEQGASARPRPDGLNPARRDSPARLDVIASHEALKDGDERRLADQLGRHYPLTMLDPGAAGLTKLLTVTDQLVVVVPASVEASGALADTRDWLDAHGFADLATHSVTLINGVSRRSMGDVAQAEAVARGRCRAIVRVPWDDMLPVGVTGPSTLRPQTRVAYTALAGVLVAGMAAAPIRKKQ
jgi:hypothetical protein